MELWELPILLQDWEEQGDGRCPLVQAILQGQYLSVLASEQANRALCFHKSDLWRSWNLEDIAGAVSAATTSHPESRETLFLCGVAAIYLFAEANWTGPSVDAQNLPVACHSDEEKQQCLSHLSVDGSDVYRLLSAPEALAVARVIFEGCQDHLSKFPTFSVWRIRYCHLYQQTLDDPSPHLYNTFIKDIQLSDPTRQLLETSLQAAVEFCLLVANVYNSYHHVTEWAAYLQQAEKLLNINVQLIGAMGKRTYWQEPRAQLALQLTSDEVGVTDQVGVRSSPDISDAARLRVTGSGQEPAWPVCPQLPRDLRLEDDTRMNRIQYLEPVETQTSPLQQAVVLSKLFLELRAQGRDELRDEQLLVLISSVTSHPRIWSIQLSALLQRSKLESDKRRTVERAMTQTQTLVDAVSEPEPSVTHRLRLFFSTRLPTRWQMERELASRFLALGVVKSALDIYERLELWEDAIRCYHQLQQKQRAEEVVRRQIALSGETPKLLCLLGDATGDVTCYQRAWQLSEHTYTRAVRSEGLHYYFKKQYERCIPLLQRAVEMNSLQFDVWTRLAYSALQTEDWKTCAAAYRRCCHLEPDNFEAWNNIAHAYIKLGQKERAWKTLQESLKFSFDNWKIWENFLLVSVDIGEFEEALNAYNRLSDIRERHVDGEVLGILVAAVVNGTPDRRGQPADRLRRKTNALFGRLTAKITSNADLWRLYGDLAGSEPDPSEESRYRAVQHYQRAHRCCSQLTSWEKQADSCRNLLQICVKMADAALVWAEHNGTPSQVVQTLSSVKLALRGTLTKVQSVQVDATGQVVEELRQLYSETETKLQQLVSSIQSRQGS